MLVQSRARTVQSASLRSALGTASATLSARPQVTKLQKPVLSKDGHSGLIQFDLKGDPDRADDHVKPVLAAVAAMQRAHPGFLIQEFGSASADLGVNGTVGKDFARAERLSVPLTFLILLLAFGAFVAAGIPVLLALSAVLGSVGLSAIVSHVAHASDATSSVILLMGMAVGVDYSLFYVKREREERAAGHDGRDALLRAAATSGQAVLISGATVMIAMAGLLFAGSKIFESLGIGAMIVVFMSMIGSLTVLPALLGKLGDRVDRGLIAVVAAAVMAVVRRRPRLLVHLATRRTTLQRFKGDRLESRLWGFLLRPSLRHPLIAAGASVTLLVVLAVPAFGLQVKLTRLQRPPREPSDRADLRRCPACVSRLSGSGDGRRPRGQSRHTDGEGGARRPPAPRTRLRSDRTADPDDRQPRSTPSRRSTCHSPGTATTPHRSRLSARSGQTSSQRRSEG